jgi:hypothetical protein
MSGVQVAVVAPTTLLARQHFRTFAERFRGFPINVKPLSRFVPSREGSATRAGLAEGQVDIVVGTHAVLAKAVRFANLGLLVIDEEQHFGVGHKERLKELRSDVHVLTLTATPIPRTLQLSLSGVRDLSVITTPPVDRLSIRTYVSEFDTVTIREALLRERYRGGQSFFVVPRVADLPEMEDFLRREVPEVSFVTAHGQMAATELDDKMNAFTTASLTCCWPPPSSSQASTSRRRTPWWCTAPTCSGSPSSTRFADASDAPRPAPTRTSPPSRAKGSPPRPSGVSRSWARSTRLAQGFSWRARTSTSGCREPPGRGAVGADQ